jgi:hypothetical protein
MTPYGPAAASAARRASSAHPLPQVVFNLHLEVRADFFLKFSLQKQTKRTVKENA